MRSCWLLIILVAHVSCYPGGRTNTCGSDVTEQTDKIDKLILEKDPYESSMAYLRFPTHGFRADSFPLLDSNFVQSFVRVNYDTLTRKITSISFALGKE